MDTNAKLIVTAAAVAGLVFALFYLPVIIGLPLIVVIGLGMVRVWRRTHA